MKKIIPKQSGQAILMVLSILGVVSVIGLSFLYMSQMQLKGTASYLARLQTKYLAEAGISYVRKILELDSAANKVDSDDELWHTTFSGEDVDIDGDGKNESKWFYVKDGLGNDVGRYAVLVQDESAKVNLNGDGTIIKKLFDNLKLDGTAIAEDILKYRYGPDQKPAVANTDDNSNKESLEEDSLDNDSDGLIDEADEGVDEPQEFNVENPKGDDRPFVVIDELKKILGVDGEKFKEASRFVTVSSKDEERNVEGDIRQNINYIKPDNLIKIMLDRGVTSPWQKSVNTIDSFDRNLSRTGVYKHYNLLLPKQSDFEGDWRWTGNHYECDIPAGRGNWTWRNLTFSDGEYYCYIYGVNDEMVGDVEIDGSIQKNVANADAFVMGENRMVNVEGGTLTISIENNEEFGQTCFFSSIELVPKDISASTALLTKEVHGVEAIRINEIMVSPKVERNTAATQGAGGSWAWYGDLFRNNDPQSGQQGEGSWMFSEIPNGYYYLQVIGKEGEFVGDVEVNGRVQRSMRNGDYFSETETVYVQYNQISVAIQNNLRDKACYFKGIVLSQQPDAEYIELVNISKGGVDLSSWSIETTGQEATTAFIPQGTVIAPYDYLVLCVDRDDTTQGLESNQISFVDTWGAQESTQLDFLRELDKHFDFLKDVPVEKENYIILKDSNGLVVDKVEYLVSQVADYNSLERGDPTEQSDSNGDSEFDAWFRSDNLSGGTPGSTNDNAGMEEDEFYDHNINEAVVRNSPATSMVDLIYVPKVYNWERYTESEEQELILEDISSLVDSLTLSGNLLYPREHNVSGWQEIFTEKKGFYTNTPDEEGIWKWENLENGNYYLIIGSEYNEAITVSYKKADDSWQVLAQEILPNEEDLAFCGILNIGADELNGAPNNVLELKLQNRSQGGTAHFYFLRLDPLQNIYGRININTAASEVLQSLPNVNSQVASEIIEFRPFGNKSGVFKGTGDLFLSNIFSGDSDRLDKISTLTNYVTVRSNVYGITSRSQVLEGNRVIAQQEITTIIQRE